MKTLHNHTIIYDDECPMCNLYTRGFIKTKMLDANGRAAFSKIPEQLRSQLNYQRACNEIALVNRETGNVLYGVDSMFTIVGHRYTFLKPLFARKSFRWIIEKLYAFISYNRKVIAPGKTFESKDSCTPDYHRTWRWIYIAFAWIVTSIILTYYASLVTDFLPAGNFGREFIICGGQIASQSIAVYFLRRDRLLHYLGNMMTISLAGSLLLIPALVAAQLNLIHSPLVYLGWFIGVVGLMFLEHLRRVRYLGIHWSASVSWVAYRFIVLIILFWLL